MSPVAIFLLVIVLVAVASGPFYMRLLAHGPKPDVWWRGRRDGAFWFGVVLLVVGGIFALIGGGATAFAWLLAVSAAFLLSAAGACQVALRRVGRRQATDGSGIER